VNKCRSDVTYCFPRACRTKNCKCIPLSRFRCVLTTANIDRQILVGNPTIALLWIVVSESKNHSWPSGWYQIWMLLWKLQTSLDHSNFRSTYSHSENWMLNCQKPKTSLSQPLWFLDFSAVLKPRTQCWKHCLLRLISDFDAVLKASSIHLYTFLFLGMCCS